MTKSPESRGKPLGLHSQQFLQITGANTDPLTVVREAVENAIQAGAENIAISLTRSGSVVITDDGCGMRPNEMTEFLGNLGAGSKGFSRTGNLGVGLKVMAATMRLDITVTSYDKEGPAFQVRLGEVSPGITGLLYFAEDKLVEEVRRPAQTQGTSGTRVEILRFGSGKVTPAQIAKYLSNRYFELPVKVMVHEGLGFTGKKIEVLGTVSVMKQICANYGTVDLKHCKVHWGIRRDGEITKDLRLFAPDAVYLGWSGEAYKSWALNRGGGQMLRRWGVRAGGQKVVLIIEAKGNDVAPLLDRSGITGWDELIAQDELGESMPQPILDFMDDFESRHFDPSSEQKMVAKLLQDYGAPLITGTGSGEASEEPGGDTPPPKKEPSPPEGGTNGPGTDPESGEKSPGKRRLRKARGRPEHVFVDEAELPGQPCTYDLATHRILINQDFSTVDAILRQGKNQKDRRDLKALIAWGTIGLFTSHTRMYDEPPGDDVLAAGLLCPTAALLRTKDAVKLPRLDSD